MVKQWTVVNAITVVLFGSQHGQALDCCEHSKRLSSGSEYVQALYCCENSNICIIWLRTWLVVDSCEHNKGSVVFLRTLSKLWLLWTQLHVYYLAQNIVKLWTVVSTVREVLFGWGHCPAVDCCEHSNRCVIWLRTWSGPWLFWTQQQVFYLAQNMVKLWTVLNTVTVYYLAQDIVQLLTVVNTVTGVSFGSEHDQVVECCEHSNRCIIWLRKWSRGGLLWIQ